jgi:flagellar motor switch protein FliN/FliY
MADDIDVSDLSEEELNNINNDADSGDDSEKESGAGDIEMFGGDDTDNSDDAVVDDDMLADMLDQATDTDDSMVDDDMLADMLDQATDTDDAVVDDDMLADMLDQATDTDDSMVDDDMLADMLDQASDDEPAEPQLDSEGNPMDDDMAAMWGDALGEQASAEDDFSAGKVVNSDNVDYQKVNMPELNIEYGGAMDLDIIMDVPITISMEVGRTKAPIRNLLQLNQGSVIELDRLAGESLDVMVNGCLIAHGEVVVVNEKFGIRLTDIISVDERVKKITV